MTQVQINNVAVLHYKFMCCALQYICTSEFVAKSAVNSDEISE